MEVDQSLSTLWEVVLNHIGSNGYSEHEDARIGVAGFVPATEGSAMQHGILGAKGGFFEGVDLNDVRRGGMYMLPTVEKVENSPFTLDEMSLWCHVIVLRNFGSNADADDEAANIFQLFFTHHGTPRIAVRSKLSANWGAWKYITPFRIWNGDVNGATATDINLSHKYTDFDILRFEFKDLRTSSSGYRDMKVETGATDFSLRSFNLPNGITADPLVEFGELNIGIKDSKKFSVKDSTMMLAKGENGLFLMQDRPLGGMSLKAIYGINQ
ncbi:pyocin knob domain-containing protein [Enterococcus avium]|uniref:pyocin knob domain-containing protein n=1 Tax=Enterococcus avium TaxID=33945 RepID=UPI0032E4A4AA